jgi:hypothetical protein
VLATVPSTAFGLGTPTWDNLSDTALPPLLEAADLGMLRYPGGSYADIYHWASNIAQGGYVNQGTSFQTFMKMAQASNAQPLLEANYGSGTPAEAAAWVNYADVQNKYNANYWEIGNEIYGNGTYGSTWEENQAQQFGAASYADNYLKYYTAMKSVDPNIKIGVVLTTPGNWPDGQVASSYGDSEDWNKTVLSIIGDDYDFAIIHWYPGTSSGESASTFFGTLSNIPTMASETRALLDQYDATNGPNKGIFVTETNSGMYQDGQEAALWSAASEALWLQSGAQSVDWWDLENGIGTPDTDPSGTTDYEDQGILSSGTSSCSGSTCEPAKDTPFRTYYGLEMMKYFVTPGSSMVSATSSASDIQAFAATNSSGGQSVLVANTSESTSYDLDLSEGGSTVMISATVYSYTPSSSGITSTTGAASSVVVPADSLVVISLSGGAPTTTTTVAPVSTTTPVATTMPTTTSCSVTFDFSSVWTGGYVASVTVGATGSQEIQGYDVEWTWQDPGQVITSMWDAGYYMNSETVIAGSSSTIAAGSTGNFGFQGTWTDANPNPANVSVNGQICSSTTIEGGGQTNGATTTVGATTTTAPTTTTTGATTTTAGTTTTTKATTTTAGTTTTTAGTTTTTKATTTTTAGTTTTAASGTCSASYAVTSQWDNSSSGGGYTATVTVTAGSSALTSWKVTWTYANGQTVTGYWNANVSQSGSSVTATNVSYNGSLAAGTSATFGLQGNWSGSNAVPTLTCS